eukprot:3932867-Rhodomonas_salina.1
MALLPSSTSSRRRSRSSTIPRCPPSHWHWQAASNTSTLRGSAFNLKTSCPWLGHTHKRRRYLYFTTRP